MEDTFLWDGKKARVAHESMVLSLAKGGKQILDITARNEAIDLWNLQSYLVQGEKRALWCSFVDYLLAHFLEVSYVNVQAGQILKYIITGCAHPNLP